MTHRAFSFAISDPGQDGLVGVAVVAPTARYASLHLIGGAERMARRFATPAEWRDADAELNPPPAGLLESGSVLRRLVLGGDERSLRVTFVRYDDVEIASPGLASAVLDAHLKVMAGAHPA